MPFTDPEMTLDDLAALYDGLAHPARVAVLRALREARRLPLSELRRAVGEAHRELDTRNLQFHVAKMHAAGIVDVAREGGRDVVVLVRDVSLRVKPAPP